jgi:solute carrier family 40 (iron-regulated transporter), member 1
MASLSFNVISQSVEKDWIVVLSAGNSEWLSSTNAAMTQIDSGVNSFAPAITGYLFFYFQPSFAAVILLVVNVLSVVLLYYFMNSLYFSWPELANRKVLPIDTGTVDEQAKLTDGPISIQSESNLLLARTTPKGMFTDFLQSGCAGAMIAYAFLFMTVLSFGSLMTVYLRWSGLSDGMVGLLRGGAAFSGLLGAVVFPYVQQQFGLHYASAFSIVFQTVLVSFAALSFFFFDNSLTMWILSFAVVCL